MKKGILLIYIICFTNLFTKAQFSESFTDGDITTNPAWVGGLTDFTVNPAFQLQSNNTVINSTYYLSTASTLATTAQWEFYHQITFNPSSANYTDVFLTASASDLTATSTNGYFVRIGNTADEIALYRKDGAVITKIIDGVDGTLNTNNNVMKIKVVRNAANQWTLSRDLTGTGNSYFTEGVVTDVTYTTSAFLGILIKQSTGSFFQRHYFDDITVQVFVPDVTPPTIVSATALTPTTLDVLFNEAVDLTTSQAMANYVVNNSIGSPLTAIRDATNLALVHLTFASNFPLRTNLQLTVNGVRDLSANAISNGNSTFSYFIPIQFDVVIDEIMADPTPQVSLPNSEWIELRNTSAFTIDLQGWRIADATGQSGPMPTYSLKPDSFVLVCTSSAVAGLVAFGPTISVTSFPSMDNTGETLYLLSPQNRVIHTVSYTDAWYQNELKKDGGWTLEMIDSKNSCSGISNWKASADIRGGSPAKKNAVDAINKDVTAPKLMRAYATDNLNIVLVFDEQLDSLKAATANNYSISDGIGVPQNAVLVSPSFDKVNLRLAIPLQPNKVYTVTVTIITDCGGNIIGSAKTARVGLSALADSFDVVINEILFNPPSNGTDYVEIYNRSNKIIDLKQLSIANRNSLNVISSIKQLSAENYLLFPQDFMVLTEDKQLVLNKYVANNLDAFVLVNPMPSFNDDKSSVLILNAQGDVVDELKYDEKWHFSLITNREGVALERIDYNAPTQSQENWHSAATSVGYGTPTYKNSQYRINDQLQGEITTTPEIVSPDNDGMDDFATINYSFPQPGYVANITIFDAAGRVVRNLQRNALCGIRGNFRWDGLGERNQQIATGIYIIYTEVFNLDGKKKRFKNTIVVARRK
jgi:Lamin Tail Domain/Bacterial Ig-like domain